MTDGVNKYGEVSSRTDRNGNTTFFEVDANGNVTKITNPGGSVKNMTYDDKNNLLSLEDENGKKTFYVYDPGKVYLLKKAQPLNGTDTYSGSNDSNFAITQFSYYGAEYNIKGLLHTTTDPEGAVTAVTYDANGNIASKTNPLNKTTSYTYNSEGWLTEETSPEGYHNHYDYDKNGNQIKKVLNGGETYRTVYNKEGKVIQDIQPNQYNASADNLSNDTYSGDVGTRNTYNTHGQIAAATDAEGNLTSYTYDLYGNTATETKPNGSIYRYEYDGLNRMTQKFYRENISSPEVLLEEDSYAILSNHNTKVTTKQYIDGSNFITGSKTYDYANRLIVTQNPDATTITTVYNANGTIAQTIDAAGQITYYNYDGLNRVRDKWVPFEQSGVVTLYAYTRFSYDKTGRKTLEEDGKTKQVLNVQPTELVTVSYSYNSDGTLQSKTSSSGAKTEYEYDNNGVLSRQKDYTDSTNYIQTDYTNNEWGKPACKTVYVRNGDISGNSFNDGALSGLATDYTYDANGNLETETNPNNVTTTYTYDHLNRQTSVSQPGLDENGNGVPITNSKTYDSMGNVLTETDAKDNTATYHYDGMGNRTRTVDAMGGTELSCYDLLGRVTVKVSPLNYVAGYDIPNFNRTEYTYDAMGRVKTMSQVWYDGQLSEWKNYVAEAYKYDNNGNVVKKLDSLGYEAGTGVYADDKINSGYGTQMTYNYANLLASTTDPEGNTTEYTYDALGRKTSAVDANDITTKYYYDETGNILTTKVVLKDLLSTEQTVQVKTNDFMGNQIAAMDGDGNTNNLYL